MAISAQRQEQQRLFPKEDIALTSLAQRRVYVGEFYELATQALFHARRHINDSTKDWCPDMSVPADPPQYLEVKAAGNSRSLIVYQDKLRIEHTYESAGHPLSYVVWQHNVRVMDMQTREQLYAALASHITGVLVVPLCGVMQAASQRTLHEFQQRRIPSHGKRAGYKPGYRIGMTLLEENMLSCQERLIFMYQQDIINRMQTIPS